MYALNARDLLAAFCLGLLAASPGLAAGPAPGSYRGNCAACHGADAAGGAGPSPPQWGDDEIRASRIVHHAPGTLPGKPRFLADPMNLFVVVERDGREVSLLDGDRLEPIHRLPMRRALAGEPRFSPDGRFVFLGSRDGWISKFDIWNLEMVAEVRAGMSTRNLAVSGDGRYVAVANYLPHTLVILDAELNPVRVHVARDRGGRQTSPVAAAYTAGPRRSFVAVLKDVPELWELSYDPAAPEIPTGVVHDFQYREGAFVPGFLNPQRTVLGETLEGVAFFTPDHNELVGSSRGSGRGQVVHLDVRRSIATVGLPGMPHPGSGVSWAWQGRQVMAIPNLGTGEVSIVSTEDWKPVRKVRTRGPGLFMRSHENSRYAWVDAMMSRKHRDTLQVIDKQTLEVVAQPRPAPGRTLGHVEFTRDGTRALASLWEEDGALIVFDATTLRETKRIPATSPGGKYNVWNAVSRGRGSSP